MARSPTTSTEVDEVCPAEPARLRRRPRQAIRAASSSIRPKSVIAIPDRDQAVVVGTRTRRATSDLRRLAADRRSRARRRPPSRRAPTGRSDRDAGDTGSHPATRRTAAIGEPPRRSRDRRARPPSRHPSSPRRRRPTDDPEPTVALNLAIERVSRWSASRRPSRPTGSGSPSPRARRTTRPARTSTSGGSVTRARRLTTDGRSVFASWHGDRIIGGRPRTGRADADDGRGVAAVFRLDPTSGRERTSRADVATGRRPGRDLP